MVDTFEQGDIVYMDFNPQAGHEQKGRQPALVVSSTLFNRVNNLMIVCPITSTNRGTPFHVPLDDRAKTSGTILCDHVKALDLNSRNAAFKEKAPDDIVAEVVDTIIGFVEIN